MYSDFVVVFLSLSVVSLPIILYRVVHITGAAEFHVCFLGDVLFNNTHMHKSNTFDLFSDYLDYTFRETIICKLIFWWKNTPHLPISPFENGSYRFGVITIYLRRIRIKRMLIRIG